MTAPSGAEGTAPTGTQVQPTGENGAQAPTQSDRGFPADTPLEQMTDAQRTSYWKWQARHKDKLIKAFEGVTPDQIATMKAQIEALEADKLTANEKALKAAQKDAAEAAAKSAAESYLPKIRELEVKALAGTVLRDTTKLKAFMDVVDPGKFAGDDGQVDEAKVMAALTGMFGTPSQQQVHGGPRWQNAGQGMPPAPGAKPGEAGRAEAQRRAAAKKTNNTT